MALLFGRIKLRRLFNVPVRYRNGPDHWATIKKKKTVLDKALEHFDDFYGSVYGKNWQDIRTALLKEETKYIAVVNNFSDPDRIRSDLEMLGAIHLKALYDVQKHYKRNKLKTKMKYIQQSESKQNPMTSFIAEAQLSEIQSLYPADHQNLVQELKPVEEEEDQKRILHQNKEALERAQLQSIDKDLNDVNIDQSRIIDASLGMSSLDEYIPATKIKGMEDWILESDHYKFYTKGADFKIDVVKESDLSFPEHLHAYTFDLQDNSRFPAPKLGSTGVLDYYLFDGGSILPVLALDIQPGDTVLDMCAAPGGKALTILQTLLPKLVVANDVTLSRVNRIHKIKEQFVSNVCKDEQILYVTERDARLIDETEIFNKILVDVPCTTDRHVLHSMDNNLFKPTRIKERLQLPEVQTEILTNALKLVTVGGTVVYATCSLSPVQNDGVVQMALKKAWEETDTVMIVKDMTEALMPLEYLYKFGNIELRYGHLVVPTSMKNWGPMYFCKIVRVR